MSSKFIPRATPKVIAIGRNYLNHAKELGNEVPRKPLFFLKPYSSMIGHGEAVILPRHAGEIHHEVELGLLIGKQGKNIKVNDALDYVHGYCCAIDMTARDLQSHAKKKGHPWSLAKGFDTFMPISDIVEADRVSDPHNLELWLNIDDAEKQRGNTKDMIFNIPQIIRHVSRVMTLYPGDLILTGTPEGVGPVMTGQTVSAGIEGLVNFAVTVEAEGQFDDSDDDE